MDNIRNGSRGGRTAALTVDLAMLDTLGDSLIDVYPLTMNDSTAMHTEIGA